MKLYNVVLISFKVQEFIYSCGRGQVIEVPLDNLLKQRHIETSSACQKIYDIPRSILILHLFLVINIIEFLHEIR